MPRVPVRAVQDADIGEKLRNFGLQPAPAWSPTRFGDYVRSEIARWNRTIDVAGVARGKPQSN